MQVELPKHNAESTLLIKSYFLTNGLLFVIINILPDIDRNRILLHYSHREKKYINLLLSLNFFVTLEQTSSF